MGYELPKAAQRKILSLVPGARAIELENGVDVAGDDAVWIWVELEPSATEESYSSGVQERVRDEAVTALERKGGSPPVYVRYRRRGE